MDKHLKLEAKKKKERKKERKKEERILNSDILLAIL